MVKGCVSLSFVFLLLGCNSVPAPQPDLISYSHEDTIKVTTPMFIEINSKPPPFDLGGATPYVLWVNGERFHLPPSELIYLVNKIGANKINNTNVADIHKGWLYPIKGPFPQSIAENPSLGD